MSDLLTSFSLKKTSFKRTRKPKRRRCRSGNDLGKKFKTRPSGRTVSADKRIRTRPLNLKYSVNVFISMKLVIFLG